MGVFGCVVAGDICRKNRKTPMDGNIGSFPERNCLVVNFFFPFAEKRI